MKFERYRLQDYLAAQNLSTGVDLPWFHSANGGKLFSILNDRALKAMPCKVFRDNLCYFFVGRPAYKYDVNGDLPAWMLPVVFVMKFTNPPPIARVYPFDSGAFSDRRYPDYIQVFDRDRYLMDASEASVQRLIEYFFDQQKSYVRRVPNSHKDISRRHSIDGRHDEIMALSKLYQEYTTTQMDDRAAAIEVQVPTDVSLHGGDVVGVIVCEERLATPGLRQALEEISPNILEYSLYPNSLANYYGAIHERTMDLYKILGFRV